MKLKAITLSVLLLSACQDAALPIQINKNPYPSTYTLESEGSYIIKNARLLIGDGSERLQADVQVSNGLIVAVGNNLDADGVEVIDAEGKWLTPGIIDVHSHLGAYPSPGVESHQDGNEMTGPNTAMVWVEHSVWPQDPGFQAARAGGVTSLMILPGSANLFGGRSVTLKNVPATTVQGMKFPDAPYGLKMACGENPKRVYGGKGVLPSTRMGNMASFRQSWIEAKEYQQAWQEYQMGQTEKPPQRSLMLDTLMGVLEGEISIHNHCYKAEEIAMMIDMSKEFGYHAGTFHHGVEAYKVADLLAENQNCAALWPDWWGFKMEAYDMVQENVAIVDAVKNSCAIVHSDSAVTGQRLNQEAAKIMHRANRNGFDIDEAHAVKWITLNAAKSLGIDDKVGTITTGKQADLVIWNQNPFSVYAKAEQVMINGVKVYDINDSRYQALSDFELGQQ